jgi:hypothetical protein
MKFFLLLLYSVYSLECLSTKYVYNDDKQFIIIQYDIETNGSTFFPDINKLFDPSFLYIKDGNYQMMIDTMTHTICIKSFYKFNVEPISITDHKSIKGLFPIPKRWIYNASFEYN